MLAEGLPNREIADRLGVSEHTIKFHISSILDKLGAATRTEAVTLGLRMGLILLRSPLRMCRLCDFGQSCRKGIQCPINLLPRDN